MIVFIRKQLPFLFLLVLVLLPFNSFAHELTSVAAQGGGACELLLPDCAADDSGGQSNHCPGNSEGDCCDSEDCCSDAAEPPLYDDLRVNISAMQLSSPQCKRRTPEVYFAIFVPPQSGSLT